MRLPVKAYAYVERSILNPNSPSNTINEDGDVSIYLTEKDFKSKESLEIAKERVKIDFLKTLWNKGDKGHPTGRLDWANRTHVHVDNYSEYKWNGRDAWAIRDKKGRFIHWGLIL